MRSQFRSHGALYKSHLYKHHIHLLRQGEEWTGQEDASLGLPGDLAWDSAQREFASLRYSVRRKLSDIGHAIRILSRSNPKIWIMPLSVYIYYWTPVRDTRCCPVLPFIPTVEHRSKGGDVHCKLKAHKHGRQSAQRHRLALCLNSPLVPYTLFMKNWYLFGASQS